MSDHFSQFEGIFRLKSNPQILPLGSAAGETHTETSAADMFVFSYIYDIKEQRGTRLMGLLRASLSSLARRSQRISPMGPSDLRSVSHVASVAQRGRRFLSA